MTETELRACEQYQALLSILGATLCSTCSLSDIMILSSGLREQLNASVDIYFYVCCNQVGIGQGSEDRSWTCTSQTLQALLKMVLFSRRSDPCDNILTAILF
jgi:hypothetical protein